MATKEDVSAVYADFVAELNAANAASGESIAVTKTELAAAISSSLDGAAIPKGVASKLTADQAKRLSALVAARLSATPVEDAPVEEPKTDRDLTLGGNVVSEDEIAALYERLKPLIAKG